MTYATLQILTDRYSTRALIELSDRGDVATGQIDTAVVDRALTDADALIDGYLGAKYALPLASVPPLVVDLAAKIAFYNLHPHQTDEKIRADYQDAMKMLRDIANGTIRIPAAGIEPATQGSSGAVFSDRERDMTPGNMGGYI